MVTLVVKELKYDGDRLLLYGDKAGYHVISNPDEDVSVGDTVEYDEVGFNFGWFVKKVIAKKDSHAHSS